MPHSSGSVDDGYFNDLTRQPHSGTRDSDSPHDAIANGEEVGPPKTKRIACVVCRRRKLKCDGHKPKCATCARLGHDCAYDEVRRKSGPKRGYVKDLEARLAQVETQLNKTRDSKRTKSSDPKATFLDPDADTLFSSSFRPGATEDKIPRPADALKSSRHSSIPEEQEYSSMPDVNDTPFTLPISSMSSNSRPLPQMVENMTSNTIPDQQMMENLDLGLDATFSWEMIGLGLEEPMPMQEAIDELTDIYFDKIHPSLPMLHRYRYQTSMGLAPEKRPPICLRYIMWCHAAGITDKYMHHQDIFYRRARKYIEIDEMKGQGEAFVSLAHAQSWSLIAAYEFKMMFFPRAWMSVGRAARMVVMMGLNRVDGVGLDVKQCLPPPRDWTEREERRRTFWMAYCVDRYASIGTGWPMSIEEKDIMTYLPASERAYNTSTPEKAPTLGDAITPAQVAMLSSFAGVVFVTHFFGLNLTHLHRPEPNQREDDLNGEFWKRHHSMDNNLTQTSILLPSHLRLPAGVRNPNIVFLNFSIHTSTICLHQAAIFKAEKHRLPKSIVEKSRDRCLAAANAIEEVMRQTCHLDIAGMNPFMAFCLYVAARVFVQYLKKMPHDNQIRIALQFLLTAMEAMKLKNPLTESFLVQLHLDIKGNGLDIFFHNPDYSSIYMDGKDKNERLANGFAGDNEPQNPAGLPGDPQPCRSPIIHISESASSEGARSPEDTRLPGYVRNISNNTQTEGATFTTNNPSQHEGPPSRTDSPRQTQYAFRNIDLAARESRRVRPFYPEADHPLQKLHGIFNVSESWDDGTNFPVGLNPIVNNGISGNGFDTEMSDQQNNPIGLTPQSSFSYNHSSSNTSYSPPNAQDEDTSKSQATTNPPITGPMTGYTSFSPPSDNMYSRQSSGNGSGSGNGHVMSPGIGSNQAFVAKGQPHSGPRQDDPFRNMGWDMGRGGTPGPSLGMTPGGEWEKMMDSMGQGVGWGMTPSSERNG